MNKDLLEIAKQFKIEEEISSVESFGEGFINDTFFVSTTTTGKAYLLQRKNKNIFKNIPGMMENIEKVSHHLKGKIREKGGDPSREAMTIIKANDGKLFFMDSSGEFWTMCLFIDDHISYTEADSPELALAGGKGIGKFQAMLADYKGSLVDTLPGFHNIKFRFQQWDEVLKRDPLGRKSELAIEISWIESRRSEMEEFWKLIESGYIPKRITHNDTKISNILFDKAKNVLCVIDLDTVLENPILYDFGDAIRSYTNTGLEDDKNLENVSMNVEIFQAFAKGYISEVKSFIEESELKYLAFSALYITYEQVLRFLMDYIDGDNYYKTKYPTHNLVRTRAQYKLLESIEDQLKEMNEYINQLALDYK